MGSTASTGRNIVRATESSSSSRSAPGPATKPLAQGVALDSRGSRRHPERPGSERSPSGPALAPAAASPKPAAIAGSSAPSTAPVQKTGDAETDDEIARFYAAM